jgi:hypothetical protein
VEPHQTARCLKTGTDPDLPVPHDAAVCSHPPCGIYAFADPARIRHELTWFAPPPVILLLGLTELTGRVIQHARGYRAERAKVVGAAVLSADRDGARSALVEGSTELYLLFGSPADSLARHLGGRRPTDEALTDALQWLADRAAALA